MYYIQKSSTAKGYDLPPTSSPRGEADRSPLGSEDDLQKIFTSSDTMYIIEESKSSLVLKH